MKGNVSAFCQDVIGFDEEHKERLYFGQEMKQTILRRNTMPL